MMKLKSQRFSNDGDKVKITLRFRGRDDLSKKGLEVLKLEIAVETQAKIEQL